MKKDFAVWEHMADGTQGGRSRSPAHYSKRSETCLE